MGRRGKKGQDIHGWLVLDKPYDMGSTTAVAVVKRLFDAKKAGHAGTLDPLATGILPIALGEATKTVSYAMADEKSYGFTVTWGAQTSTDDKEGEVTAQSEKRPSREEIEAILAQFIGSIDQIPPLYSAIKIKGERAYKLARDGEKPELSARQVEIMRLEIVEHLETGATLFEIDCGKGTYIRSIARDMGRILGCFGHVSALRRTRVGSFSEKDTISLELLEKFGHSADDRDTLLAYLKPVQSVLDDIPALSIDEKDAAKLKNGQIISIIEQAPDINGAAYAVLGEKVIALGDVKHGNLHPLRVFNI